MSIVTCRSHLSRVPQLLKDRSAETLFNYIGGPSGDWQITKVVTHSGPPLKPATHLSVANGQLNRPAPGVSWIFSGLVSNTRYVTREDQRPQQSWTTFGDIPTTCAALVPVRKSSAWWNLAQAERREIVEARSSHLVNGFGVLPAIARRLRSSQEAVEPFDFVTWFEYSVHDEPVFNELLAALRGSDEWQYVKHEVDIRLTRIA